MLLGQFTNKLARKLAQQSAFFRKKQYNNVFGSLENYKGSVCYMSHSIEKRKVLVIHLGDVRWPGRLELGRDSWRSSQDFEENGVFAILGNKSRKYRDERKIQPEIPIFLFIVKPSFNSLNKMPICSEDDQGASVFPWIRRKNVFVRRKSINILEVYSYFPWLGWPKTAEWVQSIHLQLRPF
jgi:hypothetical protein